MPQRRAVPTLASLCLQNLARHMQKHWAKDYNDKNLDEYKFRFIVGPFNDLPYGLVQELLEVLRSTRRLSRAALHLLLVPQLRQLSLRACPTLVNNALGQLIVQRCQNLSSLDLGSCWRLSPSVLVDLVEGLPRLTSLGLANTQANGQVLSAVGSCCPLLRELDVSRCSKVTPHALWYLGHDPVAQTPGCPALRILLARELEPTGHEEEVAAVAFLLLALPRLEVLAHHVVPDALRLLHTQELHSTPSPEGFPSLEELARGRGAAPGRPPLTLPLKQLEEVEEDALGTVQAVCPHIKKISVWLGDDPTGLQEVLRWVQLSQLTLGCLGRRGRALLEVLPVAEALGTHLEALTLHGFSCPDPLSLRTLLASCPGLRSFCAEMHIPRDPNAPAEPPAEEPAPPPRWAIDLLPQGLPQLQSFSLALDGPVPATHGPVLSATLASVLSQAPQLRSLRLLNVPIPLEPAPAGPELRELQELSLAGRCVSPHTVWHLLGSEGPLRRLVLSRCPNIHRRHYDAFVQAVQRQHLDLDITWE